MRVKRFESMVRCRLETGNRRLSSCHSRHRSSESGNVPGQKRSTNWMRLNQSVQGGPGRMQSRWSQRQHRILSHFTWELGVGKQYSMNRQG